MSYYDMSLALWHEYVTIVLGQTDRSLRLICKWSHLYINTFIELHYRLLWQYTEDSLSKKNTHTILFNQSELTAVK